LFQTVENLSKSVTPAVTLCLQIKCAHYSKLFLI